MIVATALTNSGQRLALSLLKETSKDLQTTSKTVIKWYNPEIEGNSDKIDAIRGLEVKDAPNRAGKVFTIHEFKKLLTMMWIVTMSDSISLVEWIILAFCAKTFLLGALRNENFQRFRNGGVQRGSPSVVPYQLPDTLWGG